MDLKIGTLRGALVRNRVVSRSIVSASRRESSVEVIASVLTAKITRAPTIEGFFSKTHRTYSEKDWGSTKQAEFRAALRKLFRAHIRTQQESSSHRSILTLLSSLLNSQGQFLSNPLKMKFKRTLSTTFSSTKS
jgi:hypothetical protein